MARSLAAHLTSDDAGLRGAVVEALAAMPVGVLPMLPGLTADTDPDVRIMTALILADLQDPSAASWLIRMVTDDPHPNVVATAIDALLPLVGEEGAELLRQVGERFPADPFLRFTVDVALARLTGVTR